MAVCFDRSVVGEALVALLCAAPQLDVSPGVHATPPPDCDVVVVPAGGEHEVRARGRISTVVVGPDDVDEAAAAFRAGAGGYVSTTASGPELVEAISLVARGGTYLSERLAADIGRRSVLAPTEIPRDPLAHLSPRQREVLDLLATGADRASIAAALGLSVATVRTHLRGAFARLGVHSSIQAVSVVVRANARLARTA